MIFFVSGLRAIPWRWFLLPSCLTFLAFAACRGPEAPAPEELRVGLVLEADEVEPIVGAARLAAERWNAQSLGPADPSVRIVARTDHTTPEGAVAAARELVYSEHVTVLVASLMSRNAIPVAAFAESAKVPMVTPGSTHVETTAGKHYVFRVPFIDAFQGSVLARFAGEDLRARRAAVLYDVSETNSRSVAEVFQKAFANAGGRIVASETFTMGEDDFRRRLEHIRDQQPEVLLLPNPDADLMIQARQARELGIDAIFLGGDWWTPQHLTHVPELEGAYSVQHWHPDLARTSAEARIFANAYRERFGSDPTSSAALVWDAFGLVFAAAAAGTDPESIRDGLARTTGYRGATGEISYADGGDPSKTAMVLKITAGAVRLERRVRP